MNLRIVKPYQMRQNWVTLLSAKLALNPFFWILIVELRRTVSGTESYGALKPMKPRSQIYKVDRSFFWEDDVIYDFGAYIG
jgi:hypothetical protein